MEKITKVQEFFLQALDQFGRNYAEHIDGEEGIEAFSARLDRLEKKIDILNNSLLELQSKRSSSIVEKRKQTRVEVKRILGDESNIQTRLEKQDLDAAKTFVPPSKLKRGPGRPRKYPKVEKEPKADKPRKGKKRGRKISPRLEALRQEAASDELRYLTNMGPVYARLLHANDIDTLVQMAAITDDLVEMLESQKSGFKKRFESNDWKTEALAFVAKMKEEEEQKAASETGANEAGDTTGTEPQATQEETPKD